MLTFAFTIGVVVAAYLGAQELQAIGVIATAVFITAVDAVLPSLIRLICSLERHHNVVAHDLSLMNKVSVSPTVRK